METLEQHKFFGGTHSVHTHDSAGTGTAMRFAVFIPPQAKKAKVPVLWCLAGLTCTEENFSVKAGAQRVAAELGLALVMPDTSPRGAGIPGEDDDYDLGTSAGFYLDATQAPWSKNYRMESYLTGELRELVNANFPVLPDAQGITGHSMGGHGALTLGLKYPDLYRSISAFSPICAPSQCPWGEKAFTNYLGANRHSWLAHDATALIEAGKKAAAPILIDQGDADQFLDEQLHPHLFEAACSKTKQELRLRRQPGYDHSYFFIASFIDDHLRHHAAYLLA